MKKIILLFFTLLLGNFISAQCLTSTQGQYPATTYSSQVCNGLTVNSITTCGYGSEYSAVTVIAGETYTFSSSVATDTITISADSGATAAAFGVGSVTWVSTISGDIWFYTHIANCGEEIACRTRSIVCGTPPTCISPTALTFSNITTTSATVSWTASTTVPANGYEYIVSTTNTAPIATSAPTGNVAAGVTTVDLSNLTSGTTYYVWVRSVCSSTDSSSWSSVGTFSTLCTTVTDFTENFDAALTFPACWARVGTGGSTNVQSSASGPSQPNVLYIYGSSATSQGLVAMKPVSNAGDGTHRLRFKARGNFTLGGNIEVGYVTNPSDPTTFVGLQTFTTTSTTVYDLFTATLGTAPGTNQVLAFRHTGTPAYSILIDDVVWEAIPSCIEPTQIVASAITTTSATISWTAPTSAAPANGYEYYLATTTTAPSLTTTATGSVGVGITTANLTALTPATTYYVWVRSVCSSTDSSSWSIVSSFATPCIAMTTLPWTENFDALTAGTNIFPSCWAYTNTLSTWSISTTPVAHSGANSLRRTWSTDGWAFTPMATLTAGVSYSFSYYLTTNDTTVGYDLTIGVGNGQTATSMTTTLSTVTGYQGPTWTKFTYQFTPTTSGDYSFGIHVVAPVAPNGINFDDFKLEVTPSCLEPTLVVSSNITTTTATISWTASTSTPANGYEYYVATTTTAPSTSTTATGSVGAGITTANLTALTAATTYYVWVRSVCSSTDSSGWSISTSFTTPCNAIATLPWTENFDTMSTIGANVLPSCWTTVAGTKPWTSASTTTTTYNMPMSAPNYMQVAYGGTVASDLWTPGFALTAGQSYDFSFNYNTNGTTSSYIGFTGNVFVNNNASLTGATNLGTFITSTQGTATYTLYTVTFVPATSGTYYFDVNVSSTSAPWYLGVDDFQLKVTPPCTPPAAPTANAQSFCVNTGASVANLVATGTGTITWYADAAATTALASTTLLSSGTYYVGQTLTNCQSPITPVVVTLTTPVVPIFTPVAPICAGSAPVMLPPFSVNQIAGTWSPAMVDTMTTGTYLFTPNAGQCAAPATQTIIVTSTSAPSGASTQTFINGQTVGDLVAVGTAIVWYTSANDAAVGTNPIPFTTALVDGTTYYATQTVGNCTSMTSLAVTVIVTLATDGFDSKAFTYYPNPVKDVLSISYTKAISEVRIYTIIGQEVAVKSVNATQSEIDLSNLPSGTYMVKVTSDNQTKTIKVIKE